MLLHGLERGARLPAIGLEAVWVRVLNARFNVEERRASIGNLFFTHEAQLVLAC